MDILLARQPIFDLKDRVAGYELLYRANPDATVAGPGNGDEMSGQVIVDAFLGIGLGQVTEGRPAYINVSRDLLLSGSLEALDRRLVVIELLETIEPDVAVVAACSRLVRAGYRLALDDVVARSDAMEPLVELASIVKVDVLGRQTDELLDLTQWLAGHDVTLLAEKVESSEVHDDCVRLGFELFQGYHYRTPETVVRRDIAVRQLAIMRVLNMLRDERIPNAEIEDAFRADVSLSYKLLRMVNSAAMGHRGGIRSIGHAIRLLGRDPLYRWVALLLLSASGKRGGIDQELIQILLTRARFCEAVAEARGDQAGTGPLFLVGLFSLLNVLLSRPMLEIVTQVDLAEPVTDALLRRAGPYAAPLQLIEAYEAGSWETVDQLCGDLGLPAQDATTLYLESLNWSRARLTLAAA